ncbi:MAG: NADP-dependent malic enzyme [Chloroflexi bacterium]|nr:NADP-dependent malic enzyme [Chloroflexota bacterium]
MGYDELALAAHREWRGKIDYASTVSVTNHEELSVVYTPGVAAPCLAIERDPELVREMTGVGNLVAVVTDGSAVLGLGNIGPQASLPVMEGKCVLFKQFGGVNAIPIALDVHDTDGIVAAVKAIAPSLGGINLEDIAAPVCFEVEAQLHEALDIPVMHDDQHGTAVVALAGVINGLKLTNREPRNTRTVVLGAGAGGIACAKMLRKYGVEEIAILDSKGLITSDRDGLNPYKREVAAWNDFRLNPDGSVPQLSDVIRGADLFLGLSGPDLVSPADVASMNREALVFPMANPNPEILPAAAAEAGAAVIATGRSDFPNQINNALAFPGIFRGLLDAHIPKVQDAHKLAAAQAIADFVSDPTPGRVVPSIFEDGLGQSVAQAVMSAE